MNTDGQCKQRDGNPRGKKKRSAVDKKYTVTDMKNAFDGLAH